MALPESLKAYEKKLIPLSVLKARIDDFASKCLPDFKYDPGMHDVSITEFQVLPGEQVLEARMAFEDTDDKAFAELDVVGLKIHGTDAKGLNEGVPARSHVFTRWARSQLLAHFGAREKWFWRVSLQVQATELNHRRHTFANHRLRLMHFDDQVNVVRGLVSEQYADIPDTDVAAALVELVPDGYAVDYLSGKTDRTFYTYVVSSQELSIPGTEFCAVPGVVVRNSEVGYTSLWVTPMIWMPRIHAVAVMTSKSSFRHIHRGKVEDLVAAFDGAMKDAAVLWGTMPEKLIALEAVRYANADEAVTAMKAMVRNAKASKLFAYRCEQAYQAAQHNDHTGRTVFEAILSVVRDQDGEDAKYDAGAIAGAVLVRLVF